MHKQAKPVGVEAPEFLVASAAATKLGVCAQTVRNHLRAGVLRGYRESPRRWLVETASVEEYLARGGTELARDDLAQRVEELAAAVRDSLAGQAAALALVQALERERDRYRADAAAARAAALTVNASARELDGAVRKMLEVLAHQSDALIQLLAPGTPEDLTR